MTEFGPSLHFGRGVFIRSLPRARRILDIGGAAVGDPSGGLVLMGYPYRFDELVVVDLPSEDRHAIYRDDVRPASAETPNGPVTYRYHSMTDLSGLAAESFDLVYSGQSIEHVTQAEAESVLAQVRRVLRPGGVLALDTPNSRLTRLQQDAFVDPDHKYEYSHKEMVALLEDSGFVVERRARHQLRGCVRRRRGLRPDRAGHRPRPLRRRRGLLPAGLRLPPPRLTRRAHRPSARSRPGRVNSSRRAALGPRPAPVSGHGGNVPR